MATINNLEITPEEEELIKSSWLRNEEELKRDITALKEWLQKQAHLPQVLDERLMKNLLIKNKGSLEKTKKKIDNFYRARTLLPELFDKRDMHCKAMKRYFEFTDFAPLPKLAPDRCRIMYMSFNKIDIDDFDATVHYNALLAMLELILYHDNSEGEYIIADCTNVSFKMMIKFTPTSMRNFVSVLVNSYTERLKGVYCYNLPSFCESMLNLFRMLISDKIGSRVLATSDLETLYSYMPKKYLPSDLGGEQPPIKEIAESWKKFWASKNEWLIEQANLKTNEKLRVGEPIGGDFFGSIPGSFRQLDID